MEGEEDEVGVLHRVGQRRRVADGEASRRRAAAQGELGPHGPADRLDGGPADRVVDQRLDLLDVVVQHVEEPDLGVAALEVHQVEADVVPRGQQGQADEAAALPADLALAGGPAEDHVDPAGPPPPAATSPAVTSAAAGAAPAGP